MEFSTLWYLHGDTNVNGIRFSTITASCRSFWNRPYI